MRTATRFTALVSIAVVTAVASAFAQPAKPGPDGWTTGSGGSAVQPGAGARTAAPAQPALGPPGAVPSRPASPGSGESETDERNGPFVVGSLGVGQSSIFMVDLQFGWMISSRFSPFVSLGGAAVFADGGGGISFTGIGARLWFDKLFMEGRVTRGSASSGCDFDDPCTSQTTNLGIFGLGIELAGSRNVGFEARAQVLTDGHDAVFIGTLGLGLYL